LIGEEMMMLRVMAISEREVVYVVELKIYGEP